MGRTALRDFLPEGVDVGCIACGQALYYLPEAYPLSFHCENGHLLTPTDLLGHALEDPPSRALELWPMKALFFRELAEKSLKWGHALPAADFQESANRIDRWTVNLRELLAKQAPREEADAQPWGRTKR